MFVWGLIENTLQSWDSINHIHEIVIIFFPTQQINTNKLPEYIRHPYSKLQQNWTLSPWGGKYIINYQAPIQILLPAIFINPKEELALVEHSPKLVTLAAGALHAELVTPGQQLSVTPGSVMTVDGLGEDQRVLHVSCEENVLITELGHVPVLLAA